MTIITVSFVSNENVLKLHMMYNFILKSLNYILYRVNL